MPIAKRVLAAVLLAALSLLASDIIVSPGASSSAVSVHSAHFTYSATCGEMDNEKCWLISVDGGAATESDAFDAIENQQEFVFYEVSANTLISNMVVKITTTVLGTSVVYIEENSGANELWSSTENLGTIGYSFSTTPYVLAKSTTEDMLIAMDPGDPFAGTIEEGEFIIYWTETELP